MTQDILCMVSAFVAGSGCALSKELGVKHSTVTKIHKSYVKAHSQPVIIWTGKALRGLGGGNRVKLES